MEKIYLFVRRLLANTIIECIGRQERSQEIQSIGERKSFIRNIPKRALRKHSTMDNLKIKYLE